MSSSYQMVAEHDRLGRLLGIEVVEVRPGYAKTKLLTKEEHLNGVGVVHGGVLTTLADIAFALAVNAYGEITLAIHLDISFLKAVRRGVLFAEAQEISRRTRIVTCDVKIQDESGELVALFHGVAYRTGHPLPQSEARLKETPSSSPGENPSS